MELQTKEIIIIALKSSRLHLLLFRFISHTFWAKKNKIKLAFLELYVKELNLLVFKGIFNGLNDIQISLDYTPIQRTLSRWL